MVISDLKLSWGWILVKPESEAEKQSEGGIYIPAPINTLRRQIGHVLSVGFGRPNNDETGYIEPHVKVGDKIWFDNRDEIYGIVVGGHQCRLITEDKVIGIDSSP